MKKLAKITLVLEEFSLKTPAQQILDRFLIGYPRDGEFHRLQECQIILHLTNAPAAGSKELEQREKDFGLVREPNLQRALSTADAVIVIWRGAGASANEEILKNVIEGVKPDTGCFVHGVLANSLDAARTLSNRASERKVALLAGTPLPVTWRLPEVDLGRGTLLKEGLVVVQGAAPAAELHGLDALLPVIELRQGGERGIRSVQLLRGENLWQAGSEGKWSWPLLASAISRSNNPQGDPLQDGRTQDLAGLGLIPKLARDPRGWILEHRDGLRSAILVLDGVVGDFNFAVQARDGKITSAQIYRPQQPQDHQFSRLADIIEEFLRGGKAPWPIERSLLIAGTLAEFAKPSAQSGRRIETSALEISYQR
jgi:hypothetical protein